MLFLLFSLGPSCQYVYPYLQHQRALKAALETAALCWDDQESMFFFFNAECLPHPKWKSETGRFWLRPSSLQVCTCPSDRDLNSHFQKSFGVTLPFCGFSPMAFACTYVGTPYYVPPEIWENLPYNNKRWVVSLFG